MLVAAAQALAREIAASTGDAGGEGNKAVENSGNVFFVAPTVDYHTSAAGNVKLVVAQDDTWPRDTPEELRRITCEQFI